MRSLNPDTDSHTTKTGKEGFTLKANQKEENLSGCAAPTKNESEGIDTDIEALELQRQLHQTVSHIFLQARETESSWWTMTSRETRRVD